MVSQILIKIRALVNQPIKAIKKVGKTIDALNKTAKQTNVSLTGLAATLAKVNSIAKRLQAVFLGMGLAMLFFGMALRKAALSGMRAVINTWAEAMEGTAMYNKTLGRLNAAFTFLKFSIMDAFMTSSLGMMLIDMLIGIIDWVNEFISKHPEIAKFIFIFLAIAFVVGTLLMIFGQILLAMLFFTAILADTALGALVLGAAGKLLKGSFGLLGKIFRFAGGIIKWFTRVFIRLGSFLLRIFMPALRILGAGLRLLFMSPLGLIVLVIILVIAVLVLLWKKNEKFRNFIKAAWAQIKEWMISAINAVMEKIQGLIDTLTKAWDLMKKVAGGVKKGISKAWGAAKSVVGLAHGGIVTSPTRALIGEAGPEAVIPLDQMGGMGGTNNINVEVNVGGSESPPEAIAEAVIEAIQRELSRRGLSSGV